MTAMVFRDQGAAPHPNLPLDGKGVAPWLASVAAGAEVAT